MGVFDGLGGAPGRDGTHSHFRIAQLNQSWSIGRRALAGRLGVGGWQHTGLFARTTANADAAPDHAGTHGWYATLDQDVWQGGAADDAARPAIGLFAQLGTADRAVASISGHRGGGLSFRGLWGARPNDQFGVGATHATWSGGREGIQEVYYQTAVLAHLSVTADWQHVSRRALGVDRRAGHVATLRTVVTF